MRETRPSVQGEDIECQGTEFEKWGEASICGFQDFVANAECVGGHCNQAECIKTRRHGFRVSPAFVACGSANVRDQMHVCIWSHQKASSIRSISIWPLSLFSQLLSWLLFL